METDKYILVTQRPARTGREVVIAVCEMAEAMVSHPNPSPVLVQYEPSYIVEHELRHVKEIDGPVMFGIIENTSAQLTGAFCINVRPITPQEAITVATAVGYKHMTGPDWDMAIYHAVQLQNSTDLVFRQQGERYLAVLSAKQQLHRFGVGL